MSSNGDNHIVKSFDGELQGLRNTVGRLAGQAEKQLATALQALADRDGDLAAEVVDDDREADQLEQQISDRTLRVLALRSPVADDLRIVVSSLKVGSELERIADLAANVAKRSVALNEASPLQPVRAVLRMGQLVAARLKQGARRLPAAGRRRGAGGVQEVDDLYSSLFREILTYMMEDPRTITPCTQLMFIAKNLERIGDHATNVAEMAFYLVKGQPLRDERPKHDVSSYVGRNNGPD